MRERNKRETGAGIIKEKDPGKEKESEKMTRPLWGEPTWAGAGGVKELQRLLNPQQNKVGGRNTPELMRMVSGVKRLCLP